MATIQKACSYSKFGHCRYGSACRNHHFDSLCTSKTCSINECNKRHPKKCRYLSLFGRCKFGQNCSYKHEIEVVDEVEQLKTKYETLTQSINQLQCELSSLKAKLMDTIGTTLTNTQSSIQPNTTVVSDMQKVPQVDGAQDEASFFLQQTMMKLPVLHADLKQTQGLLSAKFVV